jgi:hypothetical protein
MVNCVSVCDWSNGDSFDFLTFVVNAQDEWHDSPFAERGSNPTGLAVING